ncbi:MAG: alanine--tRNA ligase [Anaerolineales bacterium]|nr:alanine--tRNA ligase [Anaerolineales bacterium]
MTSSQLTGANIRQGFIDYFEKLGHTIVRSAPLVPGGDQTLLFTNAGMVQFKDVFLGTDIRPYTRAADSQKCMRVAGKHNDLDDVGRDDTHHTFFEMLGNWSFGDYYKNEAISWAWELLTEVWGLPRERLWVSCFRDEKSQIPQDDEAAQAWQKQPGMDPSHILFFGRKDNFWEMAETGPCGPCSEIHIDRGESFCDKKDQPGHICSVNGDCSRFLELWNLVFIQYNRLSPTKLESLPAKHVDTGMGLERIVSVLQDVDSNYKTDLFTPMMDTVQRLTGNSDQERSENITPYRVIADHSRAATFLIADGVVPGNTGRNYICRMIIRRAARFGSLLGLNQPFLSQVAQAVIQTYSEFYPELARNQAAILSELTREETRFQRTVEGGVTKLDNMLEKVARQKQKFLPGNQAFELYATYGLPLEITRDIARDQGLDVDEPGFRQAMEEHRLASGAGETFGELGGEDVDVYRLLFQALQKDGKLDISGVSHDPYNQLEVSGSILGLIKDGRAVESVQTGDAVEVVLPETCFYIESGGQVSDNGEIFSADGKRWHISIKEMRKPAAGIITHVGVVTAGQPRLGDSATARVDAKRRLDTMRNHTATHLLHHALRAVLGEHARQAGSLVAPDHLRFDFTHPESLTMEQLEKVETIVNQNILGDYHLNIAYKPLKKAIDEGATALFGEKYGDTVRNITIGVPDIFSNELCGGTHVEETGDIGVFLITGESSVAAGVRRIEAVTGREAYRLIQDRFRVLNQTAVFLSSGPNKLPEKAQSLLSNINSLQKENVALRQKLVRSEFEKALNRMTHVGEVNILTHKFSDADADTLRQMIDEFRNKYPSHGVVVLASIASGQPITVAGVTDDIVSKGINAIELVRYVGKQIGGGGGGKPTLAQAGGKDASKLDEALASVENWVKDNIKA